MKIEFVRVFDETVVYFAVGYLIWILIQGEEVSFDQKNRFDQGIRIALSIGKLLPCD